MWCGGGYWRVACLHETLKSLSLVASLCTNALSLSSVTNSCTQCGPNPQNCQNNSTRVCELSLNMLFGLCGIFEVDLKKIAILEGGTILSLTVASTLATARCCSRVSTSGQLSGSDFHSLTTCGLHIHTH